MNKFPISQALLSEHITPDTADEIAWLLEGGPGNRTAYMAGAAKRAAARVELDAKLRAWRPEPGPRPTMTDANYPAGCESRFD